MNKTSAISKPLSKGFSSVAPVCGTVDGAGERAHATGSMPLGPSGKSVRPRPKGALQRIKNVLRPLKASAVRAVAASPFLSSIHYAFSNRSFGREHQATISGKFCYAKNLKRATGTSPLLRRNIHRLEKGLLMRPLRPVFALDYIRETTEFYGKAIRQARQCEGICEDELQWAHDVLEAYFHVAGSHPIIDPLRRLFQSLPSPSPHSGHPWRPYQRDLSKPSPVSYEDMLELSIRRRSVRWFLQKPVPRELIDRAVRVAGLSPSACNRQPFVFRTIDDRDLLLRVASIPMGTKGYCENIPALAVVVGQLGNFFSERDRHLIYIDGALAAMSFAYALETLGLSSCMINWPDIETKERQMAQALNLAEDERPIMLIALGYADPEGFVAASIKKPLEQLRRYNA